METAFFVASKLVWAAIRPETVLLALALLGFVMALRGRRGRALAFGGPGFGGLVLVAVLPVAEPLLAPLERRFAPGPELGQVAGIVILGGAETPREAESWGRPLTNGAAERYLEALALARAHPGAWVLFAGGGATLDPDAMPETVVARGMLTGAGLDPARLILEDRSRNTAENAANALPLVPDGPGQIVLVTSAFHMPRAVATFCAAGWPPLTPWPVDQRTGNFRAGWNLAGHLGDLNIAVKEHVGRLAYWLTGRAVRLTDACLHRPGQG